MIDILTASIGIGLAVSLLFSEMFGLAAGGMVVPGYIALYLNRPIDILLTLLAALLTYLVVHSLSTFMIIYGKRRTVLMIPSNIGVTNRSEAGRMAAGSRSGPAGRLSESSRFRTPA